ncbi:MAG TPA: SDR family NAD(P)-dependent oxidoreductase [Thermoplasmata archaeon]|nr:SDR family NAD(P)-dependent oxidoreductase [Thermoplasmata archaeon]
MAAEGTMTGKTCVLTGATSGIGAAAAYALAQRGARVVVAGRDPDRTASTVESIRRTTGNVAVESVVADLSSLAQVRRLAGDLKDRYPRIDVLANNAGGYFARRHTTSEGREITFALNVLAPFLLTNLLLDRLVASAPARVINTSSESHEGAHLDLEDLQGRRRYRGLRAYGRSKLALQLLTYEAARRVPSDRVTVNAYHPGFVASHFGWNNGRLYRGGIRFVSRAFGVSSEEGADTLVYLATAPEVAGTTGRYFYRRKEIRSSESSYDSGLAQRLWDVCARETGLVA